MGNVSVAIAEDNEKIFRILNDLEYTKLTNERRAYVTFT